MCLGQRVECGGLSQATAELCAEQRGGSPLEPQGLEDALFDAGVADELVEFHMERERRNLSPRGSGARNAPLDAGLRDAGVRFMWGLCQLVGLPHAAGSQAAALLDIACLRHDGGILAGHLPLVCTVIVKLLKKTDTATIFVSNASVLPHAQRMVGCLRQLGHHVPDATEDALRFEETKLLVTLQWETQPSTIESWVSIFLSRFNIITRGIHAAKMNKVWEQSMLCSQALVTRLPASPEMPPLALARGLLGLSFVCVGLLPMEAADTSAILGSLQTAAMACPTELQAACERAVAALQQAGSEVQTVVAAHRAREGPTSAAAAQVRAGAGGLAVEM
ncbi:unnamed protein product [Prorocentrum cordatum]|uniref:Uncharacterized protein n=1 Tax=Prorocentrum cordatum TaxID=2364126 RepID=A0ABN9W269_9DINO|nr:unnamed protein product [Polarella glacialis]